MKTKFFQNCLGVFQGGGCRGAAYVGAYRKSLEMGITYSELVGSSVGSIVSVLIGAGATPTQLEEIIKDLDFNKFLLEPEKNQIYQKLGAKKHLLKFLGITQLKSVVTVLEHLGLYSSEKIETWLEEKLRSILSIFDRPIQFRDLIIPTTVTATNIEKSEIQIWSTEHTPDYAVAKAVRASCSIPLFFQPVNKKYVDGGMLSNLPAFVFKSRPETHFNKVLAYCLIADQEQTEVTDIVRYSELLANAIVDGAQSIQKSLQENVYYINITTNAIKATDFNKIDNSVISELIENGKTAVEEFVSREYSFLRDHQSGNVFKTLTETNNAVAETTDQNIDDVVIACCNTDWVYELFPSLLSWVRKKAQVKVYLRENNDNQTHGPYRQRLLKAIGVDVINTERSIADAYIFNPESDDSGFALVKGINNRDFDSVKYNCGNDSIAIQAIAGAINIKAGFNGHVYKPTLSVIQEDDLFEAMRNVSQYASPAVNMSIEKISISDLHFLTQHVRGYKLRQISSLIQLYLESGIDLFMPAKISYKNNSHTMVGIPVVEEIHGKLYVIEGNTRFYHCHRCKMHDVYALLVKNVEAPLPSDGDYNIRQMLLTDGDLRGSGRYQGFRYAHFRQIERAVRDPKTCLQ